MNAVLMNATLNNTFFTLRCYLASYVM